MPDRQEPAPVARIAGLGLVIAAMLVAVVVSSFLATRRELLHLLGAQASALTQTVAAAARSSREAGRITEEQLAARLLDNARLLGELDREGRLSEPRLDEIVERHGLFRVGVFDAEGQLTLGSAAGGRPREPRGFGGGRGPGLGLGRGLGGGRGGGAGWGLGAGGGAGGGLLGELLSGDKTEVVSDVHASRWGGNMRLAAGVRREGGGAIVVNADANQVEDLQRQVSLDGLLEQIVHDTDEMAYVIYRQGSVRLAYGTLPGDEAELAAPGVSLSSRPVVVGSESLMEFAQRIDVPEGPAELRLGMRLSNLRAAERRMMAQLALSLLVAASLVGLGVVTLGLRRRYGRLSRRHAQAEEALRRRDRLAAMGELASTVAHEVRNPLNAIAMSARRLRAEFASAASSADGAAEVAERDELLSVLEGETQRINRIVQQFLDFARPPRLDLQPTDLVELLGGLVEAQRSLAESRGVRLELVAPAQAPARVDAGQLRQALENLVRNATDASPEGGQVTVTLRSSPDEHAIEVRDAGRGIDPEDLPRIFDLYFTTKPDGTGVGLAVSQQVVAGHGGRIDVESEPGAGTRMTVRLPGSRQEAPLG
jgi:signal transduction histidine kinase